MARLVLKFGGNVTGTIFAGGGNDLIRTGKTNDKIDAGAGKDVISSGGGYDVVTTGQGADLYRVNVGDKGFVTITDFTDGQDRIDLGAFDSIGGPSEFDVEANSNGVVVTVDDLKLLLAGVAYEDIDLDDFTIEPDPFVDEDFA